MLTEAVGAVKHAPIDENTAATHEIVAGVPGYALRVLGLVLSNNDATTAVAVTIQDDADTPNVLIGPLMIDAERSIVIPASGLGYGQGAVGKALSMVLGGAQRVAGSITYQRVPAGVRSGPTTTTTTT
jgi:hypothetical protein